MSLLRTLIRPDHDEGGPRAIVTQAANILQIGEFQLLQLAYHDWHGHDLPANEIDALFDSYMVRSEVPAWARHYARRILELEARGQLDPGRPEYHLYDTEFNTRIPLGVRRFVIASAIIACALFGSLLLAQIATRDSVSGRVLPPYFDDRSGKRPAPVPSRNAPPSERPGTGP